MRKIILLIFLIASIQAFTQKDIKNSIQSIFVGTPIKQVASIQ